ncbi:MAG: HAD family phosphatase [Bacteroidia bacterium]|nr:HAD family phosphatase [Bacteroidia bacterium]
MAIKNMLIDLGGVLYEIDIQSTLDKYNQMRAPETDPIEYGKYGQHPWFTFLDNGNSDIDEFAAGLKSTFSLSGSIAEIKKIWKDLLIGVFPGRIEAIQLLSKKYNLALLSNTNKYHFDTYYPECKPMFDCMDRVFLSYEMGVRKPDPAMYLQALENMGWKAEETLFLDDSFPNIEAAKALGIQTYWIEIPESFEKMMGIYG